MLHQAGSVPRFILLLSVPVRRIGLFLLHFEDAGVKVRLMWACSLH